VLWLIAKRLEAIIEDKEPLVKAEEAYVVTKILEAYTNPQRLAKK